MKNIHAQLPILATVSIALLIFTIPAFLQAQNEGDIRKKLQTQFIMAEAGDTIQIPAGNYTSKGTISMDGKKNLVIRGAGMDKTVISFKGQDEGAEGINITHSENITIAGLTIQDAKGDGLKIKDTDGIFIEDVKVEWTGKPSPKNGAYGLYPVSCSRVLIDKCEAKGASDAGIYVGQSHNIIVRNSKAEYNVAGIEIENSTQADVYNCEAFMNTGGILVFDLPDLPKAKGGQVRVYDNVIKENNYKNFAPKGNIVASVPPGTGLMILATSNVEAFDNQIINNKTTGASIISYYMTQIPIKDEDYYPYPTGIYLHNNSFSRKKQAPTLKSPIGRLLYLKFKKNVPDILYDGIVDPETLDSNGDFTLENQICIRNNGEATFANLDAANNFENISRDIGEFDCERSAMPGPAITNF